MRTRFLHALAIAAATLAGSPAAADAQPVHGVAMHGEVRYGPDFRHFDYVNPDAPKGGTLKLGVPGGSYDTLNPFTLRGVPASGVSLIYDTLVVESADEPFSQYGLVAETVEMPEDRSWVVFNLRREARFHDGEAITADDVIFSFDVLKTKGRPHFRAYYQNVERAEKLDEHRVKFVFSEGENRELPLIIGQLPILPAHYWAERDFEKTTLEPPLGSGPYRIDEVDPGRSITYRRVADYWAADLPVRKGQFNFDRVVFDYYRDGTVAVEAFKAGEFDYRAENSSKLWATAYDIPQVETGLLVKAEIPDQLPRGMQAFVFNTRREVFGDPLVRRALAYAFDFETTNRNLFYSQYKRTKSYFAGSELASAGLPEGEELEVLERFRDRLPGEVFTTEYAPPSTDGEGGIRANLRTAIELLREAGWEIRDRRLVNSQTGKPFTFEILLVDPTWERIALPFVQNLERIGITAEIRRVDTSQYANRVDNFDFDMMVNVWGQSLSPGNEQRNYWSSDAADIPGSQNLAGIADLVIDELVELVISAPDRDSLVARVRALDRALLWGHYVIPHWYSEYDRIVYWNKFGLPDAYTLRGTSIFDWWYDPDKAAALARRAKAE